VLVTGDYKFDQTPVDGPPTDTARLAELGREGILLLCGDSTNADRIGTTRSEASVGPVLEEIFARAEGRIVLTSFASNVHRLQQAIDAAAALDRKVSVVGRSMRKSLNIARQLGHAEVPEGILVSPKEIDSFPDHKLVVLTTGSQGEPLSALRRMSHGEHPQVELHSDDTIIFSATPIPGNERAVNETIDRLYQIGATVITAQDEPVHASGHGWTEELKLMLNLTNPRYVMPIHGDHKRLHLHTKIAEAVGIDAEDTFKGQNGRPLEIDSSGARFGPDEQSGMIFVDGVEVGDIEDVALRDRRALSADGIFIVVATVSGQDGRSLAEPEVIFRGVPFVDDQDGIVDEIRTTVEASLAQAARDEVREITLLQENLREDVAEFVYERLRRRPMVLPVVVEV
jgi:ribonuclease J